MSAICPICRGIGSTQEMTSDDYRDAPFHRREQWYSETTCGDCEGTGSTDPAVLAAVRAARAERERDPEYARKLGQRLVQEFDAEMVAWRAERAATAPPASSRITYVQRGGRWVSHPAAGTSPRRVTA